MLLYDVFYEDPVWLGGCLRGAWAICVNGDREELRWMDDKWVRMTQGQNGGR